MRRDVQRRRREEVCRSLASPHPESSELANAGLKEWRTRARRRESSELLDPGEGKPVRWVQGRGWVDAKGVKIERGTVVLVGLDPARGHAVS